MDLIKPKGTYDLFNDEAKKVQYIERILFEIAEKYNYLYIRTPLFEKSELFHRGVGETTDIVSKETYDFVDRGNRSMTLRPEGTAGVVRSFIENKMYGTGYKPIKLFYYGPMYRYERPQSGRYREFYQFGCEVFGDDDPMIDAELISIPVLFYQRIGLKNIKVQINNLGDNESRIEYRKALQNYFKPYLDELCFDCRNRLEANPLRILDCKVENCREFINNAPKISSYISGDSLNYFNKVKEYLDVLNINYEINETLVRGLDYYDNVIFEVQADIEGFGSQNTLCGGGRYNTLVENLGGPKTTGIGFALGMERLMSAIEAENIILPINDNLDAFVIYLSEKEKKKALSLTTQLRKNGFKTDMDFNNRSLKGQFKQAVRFNSRFIIIIGEEEVKNNFYTIKNNDTKEEIKITYNNLKEFLTENIKIKNN